MLAWFFKASVPLLVFLRNPIVFRFFRGGGVRTPCPTPSGSTHGQLSIDKPKINLRSCIIISIFQHFEADFLWNSGINLKTFTHVNVGMQLVIKRKGGWPGNTRILYHRPTHGTKRKRHKTLTAIRQQESHQVSIPQKDDCKTRKDTKTYTKKQRGTCIKGLI